MNDLNDPEQIWQERADRASLRFARHPGRMIVLVVAGLIALSGVFSVMGFAFHWFGTAAHVISPENVTQQYALAFQDYNALKATASNVCAVESAEVGMTKGSDAWNQRESERLGYTTNYQRIKAEYEARMQNIFQAKKVKPSELPFIAPTLTDMKTQVC